MLGQRQCEACSRPYHLREEGDMADLNNLCRDCAAECAYQLSVDYNLPEGCSDEERQAGMNHPAGSTVHVFICCTAGCIRYGKAWTTTLGLEEWRQKYGRGHHCFRCGERSYHVNTWTDGVESRGPRSLG